MKILTAAEMREIDRRTIEEIGIPGAVLMENAGIRIARTIRDRFSGKATTAGTDWSSPATCGASGPILSSSCWLRGATSAAMPP
jgi:NAD(P)H-hydrate repair Nnr-like enzyme with NAD(P)H-hydrate epimerase domain